LALPGDADGVVRRVPLLVGVGSQVHPGLTLEAIRLGQDASAYQIDAEPPAIVVGNFRRPLPGDGFLRLIPKSGIRAPVVVSASEVLGNVSLEKLRGAIVFIGAPRRNSAVCGQRMTIH
jgi:adenylate cyclase